MMTLAAKLESSCVISQRRCKAKRYGIKSSKNRWIGFVIFLAMALFTIVTKIINKGDKGTLTDTFLNYSIYCIIAKLAITFVLKFMDNSVFSLNHNRIYGIIKFCGNVANVLVFFFTMVAYINKCIGYWNLFAEQYALSKNTTYEIYGLNVDWIYEVKTLKLKDDELGFFFFFESFIPNEPFMHLVTFALCAITIITFVPTFLYFLVVIAKSIIYIIAFNYLLPIVILIFILPVLHIIIWLKLLFRPLPSFRYVYFDETDKNYVFEERRKLTGRYNRTAWFFRNFILMLPITVIVLISATFYSLIIYTSYKYNYGIDFSLIMKQMINDYPIIANVLRIFL